MIAVDMSVLVAIVLGEPERDQFLAILSRADRIALSTASLVEARLVLHRRSGPEMVIKLEELHLEYEIEIISVDREQVDIAHTAFTRFGKGTGHPAQLNYGDLFAYALAKSRDIPLLFKGADFVATDIVPAD